MDRLVINNQLHVLTITMHGANAFKTECVSIVFLKVIKNKVSSIVRSKSILKWVFFNYIVETTIYRLKGL